MAKIRQKLDWKKSWNWLIILVPATIWQIKICNASCHGRKWKLVEFVETCMKTSISHFARTYFRLVLVFWNHCAAPSGMLLLLLLLYFVLLIPSLSLSLFALADLALPKGLHQALENWHYYFWIRWDLAYFYLEKYTQLFSADATKYRNINFTFVLLMQIWKNNKIKK